MILAKYKNMAGVINRNKLVVFYVLALSLLLLIPAALAPIYKRVFSDQILGDGMTGWLAPLLILMLGTGFLAGAVTWMQKNCLLKLSNRIEISGTGNYVWKMLNAPIGLFLKKDSFQILSQVDASASISWIITRDILGLFLNVISVVFYMIMMLRLDLLMSVIVVALIVINFVILKLKDYVAEKFTEKETTAPNPAFLMVENERISAAGLENIEVFKSAASETFFFQRLIGSKIAIINAGKKRDFENACQPFEKVSAIIFLNLLLMISALRIMDKSFTIGTYLAFQAYAGAFFLPLSEVLNFRELFNKFESRLKKLHKELDTGKPDASHDELPAHAKDRLEGYIEMKDVCFAYDDGPPVLQNINLSLKPGQRLAVIGDSGAGKTTLVKLLQGLYEPVSGEITIDGINPVRMNKHLFANSIGCANQEITIFAASVRDNISMWDESISDADVYNAASDACIHTHITSLEGAYEFMLAEHGSNLSGGQKQMLEISRAFLHNPSIVLLDEAAGFIDPKNCTRIHESLKKRRCACVEVTHNLSFLPDYDEIIILNKGQILQRGKHDELMRTSDYYSALYRGRD
ncbi:MAG: ATP-binding cassette domain-containing protein [Treponema sp.]|jgi:ABC-type bacteriocin/lantibiotic exporter with double-glycine peptidase domain|nr:ATP-binding cassette domain-containing protein [Treponema sp.]